MADPIYMRLYFADGTPVENGQAGSKVLFTLRLDQNQVGTPVRLYAEADAGYEVTGVAMSPVSAGGAATTEQWSFAPDNSGSAGTWAGWGAPLTLGDVGAGSGRVHFWVRARATDDEVVMNDGTVLLRAEGIAGATQAP